MDLLIVLCVVAVALCYLHRHVTSLIKQDGDYCGCNGGCGGCPLNDVIQKNESVNNRFLK